jgi:phospho-N-acetylmuramoyl-pentapeptide-transferase
VLEWLGQLTDIWGPLRLFSSPLFLSALGVLIGAIATGLALGRGRSRLPTDRGREHAVHAQASKGKPTGAGVLFIPLYAGVCLLVVPISFETVAILLPVLAAMLTGFLDDRAKLPWGEYRKAVLDLGIALGAAGIVFGTGEVEIWVPFWTPKTIDPETGAAILASVTVGPWVSWSVGAAVLWISINATNCTDGVDGLSASLLAVAFVLLGGLLFVAVGNESVAEFLLLPHSPEAPAWGVMAFTLLGVLGSYLWWNAHPSHLMMGDAGSRPLGLLLGLFVLATGNVFLLPVVAGMVLVNGGTGLVKVALLRFFRIGIFREVRFPLHDHVRQNLGWSAPQVLVRFVVLQAIIAPLLIVLILKVR